MEAQARTQALARALAGALLGALLIAFAACSAPEWRSAKEAAGQIEPGPAEPSRAAAQAAMAEGTIDGARRALDEYRALIARAPDSATDLREAARVASWLARREPAADVRRETARLGVEFARGAARLDPRDGVAFYYQAVCEGLYAAESTAEAKALVEDMVEHAKLALKLAPQQDGGGPDRLLARVFTQSPSWPVGVGDIDAALEHARRAVELAPHHPDNHLALAAALAEDDEDDEAREHARRALTLIEQTPTDEWERRRWRQEAEALLAD